MPSANKQWSVFVDPDDPEIPHLVIADPTQRIPTIEECERACRLLNEEGTTSIRISCQNKACTDFGGWIERTRRDVEKNVYHCQVCGKAMER